MLWTEVWLYTPQIKIMMVLNTQQCKPPVDISYWSSAGTGWSCSFRTGTTLTKSHLNQYSWSVQQRCSDTIHPNAPEVCSEAVSSWDAFESLGRVYVLGPVWECCGRWFPWRKWEESLILKFSCILFSFIYNICIVQDQANIKSTLS